MISRFTAVLLTALLLVPAPVMADSKAALIERMRDGGLVIYWRARPCPLGQVGGSVPDRLVSRQRGSHNQIGFILDYFAWSLL